MPAGKGGSSRQQPAGSCVKWAAPDALPCLTYNQPYAPIAGCHSYLPEPDDATVLRTAFNIYSKVGTALQLQSCFAREKLSVWGFLGGPTRPLQLCVIA